MHFEGWRMHLRRNNTGRIANNHHHVQVPRREPVLLRRSERTLHLCISHKILAPSVCADPVVNLAWQDFCGLRSGRRLTTNRPPVQPRPWENITRLLLAARMTALLRVSGGADRLCALSALQLTICGSIARWLTPCGLHFVARDAGREALTGRDPCTFAIMLAGIFPRLDFAGLGVIVSSDGHARRMTARCDKTTGPKGQLPSQDSTAEDAIGAAAAEGCGGVCCSGS